MSSASTRTALVVGASGTLGTAVCRELAADRWQVRAVLREGSDPAAVDGLVRSGIEPFVGDLKDPASIEPAIAGAGLVVSTASATIPSHRREGDTIESVDRGGSLALVELAEGAEVSRFVYVSSSSGDDGPATRAKRAVEERLASGAMAFTVLRACKFMEVWFSPALGFDVAAGRAMIFGSGRAPVSWISRADVAPFVRMSASDPAAAFETIGLGGPEPLAQRDAVRRIETIIGRRIELEEISAEQLAAERASAADPLLESYASFKLDAARGNAVDMRRVLDRYPVDLTSIGQFAARFDGPPGRR